MTMRFKTETGSIYEVDDNHNTWTRIHQTDASGPVRTAGGYFHYRDTIAVGERAYFFGDPIDAAADLRMIETSPVRHIEYEPFHELLLEGE